MAAAGGGFDSLSVRELKDILTERGVDHSTCVEKGDLVALCKGASGDEAMLAKNSRAGVHHAIEQNTSAWFRMRRGNYDVRVGGSEIGVIVGVGWAKPYSLYEKIVAQTDGTWGNEEDEESPPPCVHGNTCEPLIADMYAHYMKADLGDGGYYQHPDPDLGELYGASPDRRILGPDGEPVALLEIKAPWGMMHTAIKPEYMAQIQYQMWCSGLGMCDFLAVKLDQVNPEKTFPSRIRVFLARVSRSEEYIAWMMPRLFLFSKCLILRQCPERGLYDNEAMGKEVPPKPRVTETLVETSAWRVQAEGGWSSVKT